MLERVQKYTPPPRPSSGRNPLLEQMKPMPPLTYLKGPLWVAREATFDPLRGAFVVLARPDDPEPNMPERRRGLRGVDPCRKPGQVKALLVRGTESSKGAERGARGAAGQS